LAFPSARLGRRAPNGLVALVVFDQRVGVDVALLLAPVVGDAELADALAKTLDEIVDLLGRHASSDPEADLALEAPHEAAERPMG